MNLFTMKFCKISSTRVYEIVYFQANLHEFVLQSYMCLIFLYSSFLDFHLFFQIREEQPLPCQLIYMYKFAKFSKFNKKICFRCLKSVSGRFWSIITFFNKYLKHLTHFVILFKLLVDDGNNGESFNCIVYSQSLV